MGAAGSARRRRARCRRTTVGARATVRAASYAPRTRTDPRERRPWRASRDSAILIPVSPAAAFADGLPRVVVKQSTDWLRDVLLHEVPA